jgi:hypothetical protein
MPVDARFGWRGLVGVGVPLAALAAGAYLRFGIVESLRDDEGFERNVRRWTPVATEFRMRQVSLARGIIRSARFAERRHLLTPSWQQSLEDAALKFVRCESRPVYSSGRRGAWGDTGARWRIDGAA